MRNRIVKIRGPVCPGTKVWREGGGTPQRRFYNPAGESFGPVNCSERWALGLVQDGAVEICGDDVPPPPPPTEPPSPGAPIELPSASPGGALEPVNPPAPPARTGEE